MKGVDQMDNAPLGYRNTVCSIGVINQRKADATPLQIENVVFRIIRLISKDTRM